MHDLRGGRRQFTHEELDEIVRGFVNGGSPFDFIAAYIELENRPHCMPAGQPNGLASRHGENL